MASGARGRGHGHIPRPGLRLVAPLPSRGGRRPGGPLKPPPALSDPHQALQGATDPVATHQPGLRPGSHRRHREAAGLDGAPGPGPSRSQPPGLPGSTDPGAHPAHADESARRAGARRREEAGPHPQRRRLADPRPKLVSLVPNPTSASPSATPTSTQPSTPTADWPTARFWPTSRAPPPPPSGAGPSATSPVSASASSGS
jgi:hypothetical protein